MIHGSRRLPSVDSSIFLPLSVSLSLTEAMAVTEGLGALVFKSHQMATNFHFSFGLYMKLRDVWSAAVEAVALAAATLAD